MRLPWHPKARGDRLVIACDEDRFAYVQAEGRTLRRAGVEQRGGDTPAAFAKRLRALGLPERGAIAVLPLAQCQLLQIEAPVVPAEELKAAARWRIKDMVDAPLDQLTLDVLNVGDGRPHGTKQLFVAAAVTTAVRETADRARAAGIELAVIDIGETAQRNLQTAHAQSAGQGARATAALVQHGTQALLTISAAGELFYARRLDWEGDALATPQAPVAVAGVAHAGPPTVELEMMDIVDYGAEPEAGAAADEGEVPRIVIELQRSLDVWERTWPDLPLAGVVVHAGAQTAALVALLERSLGLAVSALDPAALFDGALPDEPALRETLLPLLGALLRDPSATA